MSRGQERSQPAASRSFLPLTVGEVRILTPRMRRIRFTGEGVAALASDRPAAWIKLFLDDPDYPPTVGRAYTIRHVDTIRGVLDVDFLLHGHGPLSSWAAAARPGDRIHGAGPRGGYAPPEGTARLVMLGDGCAIPAILSIAAGLHDGMSAEIVVEVSDASERQAVVSSGTVRETWLTGGGGRHLGSGLLDRIDHLAFDSETSVWVAAESGIVQALRRRLSAEPGLDRRRIRAAGYWKRGALDYRDPDAIWE